MLPSCSSLSAPARSGSPGTAHRRPTRRVPAAARPRAGARVLRRRPVRPVVRPAGAGCRAGSARDRRRPSCVGSGAGSGRGAELLGRRGGAHPAGNVQRTSPGCSPASLLIVVGVVIADMNDVGDWVLPLLLAVPLAGPVALLLLPPRLGRPDRGLARRRRRRRRPSASRSGRPRPTPETDETWVPALGAALPPRRRRHLLAAGAAHRAADVALHGLPAAGAARGRPAPRAGRAAAAARGRHARHLRRARPAAVLRVLRGRAGPDVVRHRTLGRRRACRAAGCARPTSSSSTRCSAVP